MELDLSVTIQIANVVVVVVCMKYRVFVLFWVFVSNVLMGSCCVFTGSQKTIVVRACQPSFKLNYTKIVLVNII